MTTKLADVVRPTLFGLILILFVLSNAALSAQEERSRSSSKTETQESATAADDAKQEASGEKRSSKREDEKDSSVKRIRTSQTKVVSGPGSANVSPLVKAASAAGEKSSKRRFTDADLKTTKGTLIVVGGSNVREPKVVPIEERAPEAVEAARNAGVRKDVPPNHGRELAIKRVSEEIRLLREELSRLQNEYLVTEEDDFREAVEERFAAKQKALEEAQERLKALQGSGGN